MRKDMIEEFQCAGCTNGGGVEGCPAFKEDGYSQGCFGHSAGTFISGREALVLGLPKGFNRVSKTREHTGKVRLWEKDTAPEWDHLNVAVWALEHEEHLFVRTFCPRIDVTYIDVIEGGSLELVPQAHDVSTFYDDID